VAAVAQACGRSRIGQAQGGGRRRDKGRAVNAGEIFVNISPSILRTPVCPDRLLPIEQEAAGGSARFPLGPRILSDSSEWNIKRTFDVCQRPV
jgi:hypothetical protein